MSYVKTDLETLAAVEWPVVWPYPGVLRGRSPSEIAAILSNPAAFFGDIGTAQTAVGDEPIMEKVEVTRPDGSVAIEEIETGRRIVYEDRPHDPCPEGTRGFGWLRLVDISKPLGLGETYGDAEPVYDAGGNEWTLDHPIVPASAKAAEAAALDLERALIDQISRGAEAAMARIYAPSSALAAIHARKAAMAAEVIAAGGVADPVKHDYIVEEAPIHGMTPAEFAALVLAKVAAVATAGKPIELARQAAERAVGAARGDELAMRAAADVNWAALLEGGQ